MIVKFSGRHTVRATYAALVALAVCTSSAANVSRLSAQTSGVLITHRDLALIGAATASSVALSTFDVRIARAFSDSEFHARHPGLTTAANRASLVTETVLMLSGATVWGVARLSEDRGAADVALHATASVASAAMLIQVVRGTLGRARPYVIPQAGGVRDTDPHAFQPFRGFTSYHYRSYPSMHAMASFAAATALSHEMQRRETRHREIIAPVLYVAATAPSLARMYLDEHWASDIAMGVFLGVFAGQKVVGYSHDHPDNWLDRKLLPSKVRVSITREASGFGIRLLPF